MVLLGPLPRKRRWFFVSLISFFPIFVMWQLWNSASMTLLFFGQEPSSSSIRAASVVDIVVSTTGLLASSENAAGRHVSILSTRTPSKTTQRRVYYYDLDIDQIHNRSSNISNSINATLLFSDMIRPRAFEPWPDGADIPCARDGPRTVRQGGRTKAENGLFFLKPVKTGSSTGVGIHLRIASNEARRRQRRRMHGFNSSSMCPVVYGHNHAYQEFSGRNHTSGGSFLWSLLRDPTSRLVSSYFFHRISRKRENPVDHAFMKWINGGESELGHWRHDHYLHWLSTPQPFVKGQSDPVQVINDIILEYDFIGVTERMEDVAVVLAMLLGLPLADVLYIEGAKQQGGWDDGAFTCAYLVPSFISPGMEEYFYTPRFQNGVRWDHILHQAANRSLDLTIDRLGRQQFDAHLLSFRHAQAVVQTKCLPGTVFPCTAQGRSKNTTCLYLDAACSFDCLDEVANELNLWEPTRIRT
jgi:hypothetical protein